MSYIKTITLQITHEDQEIDGLKFTVVATADAINYVQVEGPDEAIASWKARVDGVDTTIDEINAVIAALPKSNEEILKDTVTSLTTQLAQQNADFQAFMDFAFATIPELNQ